MALRTKWFVPQQDITAYELAMIVTKLRLSITEDQWQTIKPELQRHFTDEKPK
jgi:hypothetical protein